MPDVSQYGMQGYSWTRFRLGAADRCARSRRASQPIVRHCLFKGGSDTQHLSLSRSFVKAAGPPAPSPAWSEVMVERQTVHPRLADRAGGIGIGAVARRGL